MHKSKASKVNSRLLYGMMFLAVVVFGCVFVLLYMSYQKTDETECRADFYDIYVSSAFNGDSIAVYVDDSILFMGLVSTSDDIVLHAEGRKNENSMISVEDVAAEETCNENLPQEPSRIFIEKINGISIRAEKKP